MLTFRQQILSFLGDLNQDVDASSTIYASWEPNRGKTLKMLTFRQHLRFYLSFGLKMLTFGQNLADTSASFEVCVQRPRALVENNEQISKSRNRTNGKPGGSGKMKVFRR